MGFGTGPFTSQRVRVTPATTRTCMFINKYSPCGEAEGGEGVQVHGLLAAGSCCPREMLRATGPAAPWPGAAGIDLFTFSFGVCLMGRGIKLLPSL